MKRRCALCGGVLAEHLMMETTVNGFPSGDWECRSLEQCCIRSRKRRAAQPLAFEEEYVE